MTGVRAAPDPGPCMNGWCDRPAIVYLYGPTLGASPRLTVVAGPRAIQLGSMDATGLRCLDCAASAVEQLAAGPQTAVAPCLAAAAVDKPNQ